MQLSILKWSPNLVKALPKLPKTHPAPWLKQLRATQKSHNLKNSVRSWNELDWSGMNEKIWRKKFEGIRCLSTFEISDYNNRKKWSVVLFWPIHHRLHFIFEIMVQFQFSTFIDACGKMCAKSITRFMHCIICSGYLFPVLNWIKFLRAVRRFWSI